MNKKLLAIAVGAAISAAPMFASAAVKVYGHAQVEVSTVDNGTTSTSRLDDSSRGRIGFKASEKLGNGLTAYAKFEFAVDTADGARIGSDNGPLSRRGNHVGLKGSFGAIELGRLSSAYKYAGGVKYDPFVATRLQARGANGMSGGAFGHNSFLSDSIGYKTPKMGGLSAWVTIGIDETNGASNDGDYSFNLKYKQKAFEVFIAGINNDSANYDGIKVGGQFKFSNFKISAQIEDISTATGDIDVWFLGGQAKFGSNVLVAQFGNTDNGATDLDYFTVGVIHNMSKKTRLTAGFRGRELANGNDEDTFSVSLRMKF